MRQRLSRLTTGISVRVTQRLRRLSEHPDEGAITIEQVGWAVFWAITIATLVGLFGPWLLAKANTITSQF